MSSEGESLLQWSSCSQDLNVTHLFQQTTSHHSDTTWDMRHTACGAVYVLVACDVM